MESEVKITFATGGFVVTNFIDGKTSVEVFPSQAKLLKALRTKVTELSLVAPKKEESEE